MPHETVALAQENKIDLLIELKFYREGFMFSSPNTREIQKKVKKLKNTDTEAKAKLINDENLKYSMIPKTELKEIISISGDIIDQTYLKNYENINSKVNIISENMTCTIDIFKRKDLYVPTLSSEQKEFLKNSRTHRDRKDKEKMRVLMRNN